MGKITGFLEIEREDRAYEPASDRVRHYREFVIAPSETEIVRQAALAPERLAGEADLTRLRRRRVDQPGRGRNPRLSRKRRFIASLLALHLRHLDGKGRRLPGIAKSMDPGDFFLL